MRSREKEKKKEKKPQKREKKRNKLVEEGENLDANVSDKGRDKLA
jgi:hypothetical protein